MANPYAGPPVNFTDEEWNGFAAQAILRLLEEEHAATVVEMEAKISDQTYASDIVPRPINPHHLTNARQRLADEGLIQSLTARGRSKDDEGHPVPITTWSLPRVRGRKTVIEKASERKRALTARWMSWGRRRLLGNAGEDALAVALARCTTLTRVTGSTNDVLGVDVAEVDNTAVLVVEDAHGLVPVQVMFEVKNTREHFYANNDQVLDFLRKAAIVQQARPKQLILPVFICRRWHYTLWEQGTETGFLPAMVMQQVVNKDPELSTEEWEARLGEVRGELFTDLRGLSATNATTNRHRGVVEKLIPRRGLEYASRWAENYVDYLPN